MSDTKVRILMLCIANAARSQMAEGLARDLFDRELGEGVVEVESAGSSPAGKVASGAVRAMADIQIDISHHRSKHWDELDRTFLSELNYVISLCEENNCPYLATKAKRLNWRMSDPGANPQIYANIRDAIAKRLREELLPEVRAQLSKL